MELDIIQLILQEFKPQNEEQENHHESVYIPE